MKLSKFNKSVVLTFVALWIITGLIAYSQANSEDKTDYARTLLNMGDEDSVTQLYNNSEGANSNKKQSISESIGKLYEVMKRLNVTYVDDIDNGKLMEDAINGMLKGLDPHTSYFTPEEFKNFTSSTKGEFGGLGIQIDKKGDYITVVSPIEGTPAYRMGIMAGDMIWKVDGEDVTGISTTESINKMRGEIGSEVTITVIRPGHKEPLDFKIIRDVIKIKSVPYSFKLDNDIGYVRVTQFNSNTSKELATALDKLEEDGMEGLIIDLRFNPGGLLSEAINTVNEFIGKDKRVVYTKGRLPRSNEEYMTRKSIMRDDYPIIVLINEASASASEIFSGSMQDYDRGLVMGKTSFGKGSVQQLFPLTDGSGIKITTSHYYINSGRCIHKIINDKILTGKKVTDEEKEDIEKSNHEHIYKTQSGRIVYGGGGITPDIEVSADTLSKFELELRRKNDFFNFAVDYMLDNSNNVDLDFKANDRLVDDFMDFVIKNAKLEEEDKKDEEKPKNKVKKAIDLTNPQAQDIEKSREFIKLSLTSEIIEKKYGSQEGYKIRIAMDTQLQEAKKMFDKYESLEDMFEYSASLKEGR
jgi:carboxyl-terminal processing protease